MPAAGGRGVGESGDDDAGERGDDSGEKHPGETRDGAEIAIEERGDEKARGGGGKVGVVERGKSGDGRGVEAGPEESEKTGEADAAGGDGERRGEADLPDVEKTEPVAGAVGAVDLVEEGVAAAGARKSCAELGPDEAVGDGDDGAEHPRPDGEPIAGRGNDERQSDEGADADHLEHVEEDGGAKADAALEMWRSGAAADWIELSARLEDSVRKCSARMQASITVALRLLTSLHSALRRH